MKDDDKHQGFWGSDAMFLGLLNLLIVAAVIVAALDEQGII